jgi:hypothetical protein
VCYKSIQVCGRFFIKNVNTGEITETVLTNEDRKRFAEKHGFKYEPVGEEKK